MIIKKTTTSRREFDNQQREIYRITNKLINEFSKNCLVRGFVHDANKRMNEMVFLAKMPTVYQIDDTLYTNQDIREFLFHFIAKFPFHLYKKYGVFKPENGFFKISFKIGNNENLLNFTIKDESQKLEKRYPVISGVFVNI